MPKLEKLVDEWLPSFAAHPYVQAILIIVVFILFAYLIDRIVKRVIPRLMSGRGKSYDGRLASILHKPLFVTVLVFGLSIATFRLELPRLASAVTLNSLKTILIFVWLVAGTKLATILLDIGARSPRFGAVEPRSLPLFRNAAKLLLIAAALYFLFIAWDINVTAWLASAGIIGLAISFAAQDTLSNLFAGVSILADAPYKVGDFVVLETGERGRVTMIGIRSTRLLTRDDVEVTVPNSIMGNTKIINESGGPNEKQRIRVSVSVAYGSDIDQVRSVLLEIAENHSELCATPEPRVRFRNFGASGLDFDLLCWVSEPVLKGKMVDELNCSVYKRFIEEKIEIPYAKQDVYIKSLPAAGNKNQE